MFRISVVVQNAINAPGRIGSAGTFRVKAYRLTLSAANSFASKACRNGFYYWVKKNQYTHIPSGMIVRAEVSRVKK